VQGCRKLTIQFIQAKGIGGLNNGLSNAEKKYFFRVAISRRLFT